jgi:hypothetical protein
VLWAYTGTDSYGEPLRAAPVELRVRWSYTKRQTRDKDGNEVTTDATAVVDRLITPQGLMWLGRLRDWADDNSRDVMEVISQDVTSDVKGRATFYLVNLGLFKRSLPAAG